MKKFLSTILTIPAMLLAAVANDVPGQWEWDFTESLNSTDGRIVMNAVSSQTFRDEKGLHVANGTVQNPEGINSDKIYPELNPQGDFAIQITFQLDAEKLRADSQKTFMALVDNKGDFWPAADSKTTHAGYALVLDRNAQGNWSPVMYLGFGDKSSTVVGRAVDLADGNVHVLTARVYTAGKVVFYLDGQKISEASCAAGVVAPAVRNLAVGDRMLASYRCMEGTVKALKLLLPAPDKAAAVLDKATAEKPAAASRSVTRQNIDQVEWNFSKSINSTDGKIVMKSISPKTLCNAEGLRVENGSVSEPVGLRTDKVYPELDPQGDFTVEVTFKLNAEWLRNHPEKTFMALLDNKGEFWVASGSRTGHAGYAVVLERKPGNLWYPSAFLGFGDRSSNVSGRPVDIADGKEHTLTVKVYTAGKVEFYIDGEKNYVAKSSNGIVAPAVRAMAIGDRMLESYRCLEGVIKNVKISVPPPAATTVEQVGRQVFERTEKNPEISFKCFNNAAGNKNYKVEAQIAGGKLIEQAFAIAGQSNYRINLPVPERLRPGKYDFKVVITPEDGKAVTMTGAITVVAEENPEAMPILMWQSGDVAKLEALGFTQIVSVLAGKYDNNAPGDLQSCLDELDNNLKHNIRTTDAVLPMRCTAYDRFWRVDRQQKRYKRRNLDVSDPELLKIATESVENAARAYGSHPGLVSAGFNSEVRDSSNLAFNGNEEANYKAFSGKDFPDEAVDRLPPSAGAINDFPVLRNIDPNMELYKFYTWYWVHGDGWNKFNRELGYAYKRGLGERANKFYTYTDPVVRTPPVFGSAAGMDMVNQWTYGYQSPIKMATATDELRAMAKGNGGQQLMKETQLIWYRSPLAPKDKKVPNPPAWVAKEPDAPYISIAPDCLVEQVWSNISRRVDVLAFHGYGSMVEEVNEGWTSYRLTNTESREAFKKLVDEVIRPLGPVLKTVPEKYSDCAVLYTLGSNLFGTTGSWGWSWGPDANMHQVLQRTQLDPYVIFDEDIYNGALDNIKVLAMPNCAILDQRVIDAVREFQIKGGIVIGDNTLNALILPDVVSDVAEDHADDAKRAEKLCKDMESLSLYEPFIWSDSTEVATHIRAWKNVDYLFVVNDKRQFGDYVGMYGWMKEDGAPNKCTVSLRRNDVKAVYDPLRSAEVPFKSRDGKIFMDIDFQTNDGRMYIVMPQKIDNVTVAAPETAERDGKLEFTIGIFDENGRPVDAVLPIKVDITSGDGSAITGSGYYQVTDGSKKLSILPSINDAPGKWQIKVRDLCSGRTAAAQFEVK